MNKIREPKDRILMEQAIDITYLKIAVEQLKQDLQKERELNIQLKQKGEDSHED